MSDQRNPAVTEVLIGGDVLRNSIDIATRPVLDHLEATIFGAMGLLTEQMPEMTEDEKLHAEAIICEAAAVTCIRRIFQIRTLVPPDRKVAIYQSLVDQLHQMITGSAP